MGQDKSNTAWICAEALICLALTVAPFVGVVG